jgi:hypothetical protein
MFRYGGAPSSPGRAALSIRPRIRAMEIGRCPRCSTPYTSSEIAGFGIIRSRSARQGGPHMEYACQSCGRLMHLIPHGEGRYAPPGSPPPAFVPVGERLPPWIRDREAEAASGEPGPQRAGPKEAGGQEPPPRQSPPRQPPERPAPEPQEAIGEIDQAPIGAVEALRLLGLEATADEAAILSAFRERSRTCHPDKVAHLDEEFQELAERKFRRLQQAFELLSP